MRTIKLDSNRYSRKQKEPPSPQAGNILEPSLDSYLLEAIDTVLTEKKGLELALKDFCENKHLRVKAARQLYRELHNGKEPLRYNWNVQAWTTIGNLPAGIAAYRTTLFKHLQRYLVIYHELERPINLD